MSGTELNQLENILIGGHLTDPVKTYSAYDGLGRLEYVYTAKAEALDADPCMVTRYAYIGTTTRVLFMKEYVAAWDVSWEAF